MKTKRLHDLLLIVVLGMVALVLLLVFRVRDGVGESCVIYLHGEVYGEYALSEDRKIDIGAGCVVEISDGKVCMLEADCPNKVCVKHAPICRPGEMICCLPNGVLIRIKGEASYDFLI